MWEELEKLRAKYIQLGLSNAIDYEKFSMISIVYNSTKIEGCSLTENDTKLLIEKNITANKTYARISARVCTMNCTLNTT